MGAREGREIEKAKPKQNAKERKEEGKRESEGKRGEICLPSSHPHIPDRERARRERKKNKRRQKEGGTCKSSNF